MTQWIRIDINLPLATVTLARPEVHNAFNDAMIQELKGAFDQLGKHPEVRVIVLTGDGKSFCAGADLHWMKSMLDYTLEENIADATQLAEMLKTIAECPKPVIGRIHGAAFGGGVGLISVCDLTVALSDVLLSLSEVKLGLLPAVISPFVLRKMSVASASRYFLTAERFTAQEAHSMGLISSTVETEAQLDETIQTWVKTLLQNSPQAVSRCKTLIREVSQLATLETAMPYTTRCIAEQRISAEGQEGMRAFLEKRVPAWQVSKDAPHVS